MRTTLRVLDARIALECAPHEQRRLEDLAAALDARLAEVSGDPTRRLVLTALALMDEAQATAAALARARAEIERLTDMVVEARAPAPEAADRGRLEALRAAPSAA